MCKVKEKTKAGSLSLTGIPATLHKPHEVILPPRGVRWVAPKGLQILIVMAKKQN